ncbi:hypothetical protein FJU11_17500 [Pararhizobium mangrovi]|uniref:Uncharacterized protein n=2 Tax=Pararhizobium mangrovi TaxID=2590452 RepID=A0A506TZV6_9HYPH|nr:hypothetical protein FJU11_17500 [Pararhizobium mangrovi]
MPQPTSDPVERFVERVNAQIVMAKEAKAQKDINTRSAWFRKLGAIYSVKIGRAAMDMGNGKTLFAADDLDEVVTILEEAKTLIRGDEKLKAQIRKHAADRSERLKRGKKK